MAVVYENDFESETTSATPSGWTNDGITATTETTRPFEGSKGLKVNGDGAHSHGGFANPTGPADGDCDFIGVFNQDVYNGDRWGVTGRVYDNSGTLTAIGGFFYNAGSMRVSRFAGNGESVKATSSLGWTPAVDTWYHIKLYMDGDNVKLRAWEDGDPEPETWVIETTQTDISAATGHGIGVYDRGDAANTVYVDNLTIDDRVVTSDLSANVSDAVGVGESVSLVVSDAEISKSESVTVAESVGKLLESVISVSESVTVAEDLARVLESFINKSEAVEVEESVGRLLESYISEAESVSVEESIDVDRIIGVESSVSDDVSVGETVSVTVSDPQISVSEDVTAEESVNTTLTHNISVSEEITTSESASASITMTISVSEDISLAEQVSGEVSTPSVSVTEDVTIGESVELEVYLENSIIGSEDVSVGESVSVSISLEIGVVDNTTVDDETNQLLESYISVSDTTTTGESVNSAQAFNLSVEDASSISESLGFSYRQKSIIKNSKNLSVRVKAGEEKKPSFSVRRRNG